VFQPGSGWSYGQGLDWAGRVVEVMTGMSLEEYMQENIWSRVGMSNTTFRPERRDTYPMLEVGFRIGDALVPGQSPFPRPARHDMGGGGIHSNAHDYVLFLAALMADDSPLLTRLSVEEFLRPQLGRSSRQELAEKRRLGLVQPDVPTSVRVDHCLGGLVNVDAISGRRSAGSVCWDGMTNSHWVSDVRSL
jgi:CubicO group peptidase (beta-lactamase class C family)